MNSSYLTLTPAHATASYQHTKRATLNFEAVGGEAHVKEQPVRRARILHFPSVASRAFSITIHRKEHMTNPPRPDEHRSSPGPSRAYRDRGPAQKELERVEHFSAPGPVHAVVTTTSGDVFVRVTTDNEVTVTLLAADKHEHLLADASIHFDQWRGRLDVNTRATRPGRHHKRSWLDFSSGDLDVLLTLPAGSSLTTMSMSGDTSVEGSLDELSVSGASGDVVVTGELMALDVRSASGDVRCGPVKERLRVRSASGDVHCEGAGVSTEITTASGDVRLGAYQPGDVNVKVVSGDVRITVQPGLAVDINGTSMTGELGTNIDLDAPTTNVDDEGELKIRVTTVSGDVRIDKAS